MPLVAKAGFTEPLRPTVIVLGVSEETTSSSPTYFSSVVKVIVVGIPATCHAHSSMAVTVDSTEAALALPTDIERAITGRARAIRPAPIFCRFIESPYADERDIPLIPAAEKDWGLSFQQNKGLTLATSLALRSGLKVPWV